MSSFFVEVSGRIAPVCSTVNQSKALFCFVTEVLCLLSEDKYMANRTVRLTRREDSRLVTIASCSFSPAGIVGTCDARAIEDGLYDKIS